MFVILDALVKIGYSGEASAIDEKWNHLLAQAGYGQNPDYTICFPQALLTLIADYAIDGYQRIGCAVSAKAGGAKTHDLLNEAWFHFWSAPASYAQWENAHRLGIPQGP
jgi:hypothetical protein